MLGVDAGQADQAPENHDRGKDDVRDDFGDKTRNRKVIDGNACKRRSWVEVRPEVRCHKQAGRDERQRKRGAPQGRTKPRGDWRKRRTQHDETVVQERINDDEPICTPCKGGERRFTSG